MGTIKLSLTEADIDLTLSILKKELDKYADKEIDEFSVQRKQELKSLIVEIETQISS